MDLERKRRILEAEERAALMAALAAKGFYVFALPDDHTVPSDVAFTQPAAVTQQDLDRGHDVSDPSTYPQAPGSRADPGSGETL